ncbi:MAG: hypothetical protein ACJAZS_000525 [Alteromonas naphthalenivorans]|jgi:hypothetical protein
MKKFLVFGLLFVSTVIFSVPRFGDENPMWDPLNAEDPLDWNINNIKRTHKAYLEGGSTKADLRVAVKQANTILEELDAEQSTWSYVQEYYPTVPYVACFVAGVGLMYLYKR